MIKRLLFFFLLLPCCISAQPFAGSPPHFHSSKTANVDFGPKDSTSRVFVSIATEYLNFYSFGKTEKENFNWTMDILPLCISMEVRKNILERDSLHSLGIAFAPVAGFSLLNTNADIATFAGVPFFLEYSVGRYATRRTKKESGYAIGFGPALNLMGNLSASTPLLSYVSVDAQFTWRRKMDSGITRFHYIRAGIDPNIFHAPPGFHIDFGVGKFWGK